MNTEINIATNIVMNIISIHYNEQLYCSLQWTIQLTSVFNAMNTTMNNNMIILMNNKIVHYNDQHNCSL